MKRINVISNHFSTFLFQKPQIEKPKLQAKTSKITKRPITTKTNASSVINGKSKNTTTAADGANNSNFATFASSTKSAASTAAAQKREAQRKQLMEMKRKQKLALVNVQPKPNDPVVGVDGPATTTTVTAVTTNCDTNETDR